MIYTVTLNPAIDKTVVVHNFRVGKVNRIGAISLDPGGKGINVSKCLAALGKKSISAMLLGGESGEKLGMMLEKEDIQTLSVSVEGETRTNMKIIDPEFNTNTDINEPGPMVTEGAVEELKYHIGGLVKAGDILVLSGSLPVGTKPTVYREWCEYFNILGALVFLDADGAPMIEGIKACPHLIKPNGEELSRISGRELNSMDDIVKAGRELMESGIEEIVISLGAEGAIFLSKEGEYKADALRVPVNSTVGAGDSMVAAMAYGIEQGLSWEDRIKLSIAIGAASVMCKGSRAPEKELVLQLVKQVKVEEVII